MSENSNQTRRQFSLRLLLVMMAVVLLLVYVSSQVWKAPLLQLYSPPMRLAVVLRTGSLHRATTVIENDSDKPFDGGILVLKNDGLITSKPFVVKQKGFASIEWRWQITSFQGTVLLDLEQEIEQATTAEWIPTQQHHEFNQIENEWIYEEREVLLNNIKHNFKIIICNDYKLALSKYAPYDTETHPGQSTIANASTPTGN